MSGVKVRVKAHRAITVDDRLVEAGEEVIVPAAEAKALEAEGYVEKTSGRQGSETKEG
jgi:hypothetical protein